MFNHITFYDLLELFIPILIATMASSGFWMWLMRKEDKKDLSKRLLIGLAHDRVIYLSLKYIQRGSITQDEYENLREFLYQPYKEIGGNGTAKRLMEEVDKLRIINTTPLDKRNKEDVT